MDGPRSPRAAGPTGVLCALEGELGRLRDAVRSTREVCGLTLAEADLGGAPALLCVGGVGKVRAARAAALLAAEGVARLIVVGVCGALRRDQAIGARVHCARAVQADLAVREDREVAPDPDLAAAWQEVAPGPAGWLVTADRPALRPWRRLRLRRAWPEGAGVDMETAAAGAVAVAAGLPWAALRVVSDGVLGGPREFHQNYPRVAGEAADTVPGLLTRLSAASTPSDEGPAATL